MNDGAIFLTHCIAGKPPPTDRCLQREGDTS